VDFDDLIMLPVLFFRQHRARLIHWQHQTRYLLVDEYQDANLAQYELVLLLAGPERRFTVVGDDDQSIYAWRGARPENLARLKADVPNLEVVMLEQNYRSSGRILRSANQLISNNPHIFEKTLWSEHGPGAPLRLMVCENEDDEASQIASDILLRHFTANRKYGDFAILFRSNHQARLMELKLREQQIPYTMTGGQGFFDRAEIRDLMAYLRLMSNPSDDSAFMRIINTPRRQIGPATLAALGETAASQGLSHFEAIYSPELDARLGADALARLRRFRQWLEQSACQIMGEGDTADALSRFLDDMAYQDWLASNASNRKVSDIRYENVMTLVQEIDRLAMDHEDGVAGALSQLALRDLLDRQEANDDSDSRVQLLTLHASKGLEFPVVYMMGMEEALLPHRNSIESDDIEEERRLAYVGITRAQYELVMTRCLTRKVRGERVECQPSRFIAELPLEDIQQEGRVAEDPEDDGCLNDIFAMARSMLD
jgi:ATP-dependent DNA helicase Rep